MTRADTTTAGVQRTASPVIAGAMLLPPGDRRIATWERALALQNPAHRQWERRPRGPEPEPTLTPVGIMEDGPWAGGALVPRYAPGAQGLDRTVMPEADALVLRGELRPYQLAAVEAVIAAPRLREAAADQGTGDRRSRKGDRVDVGSVRRRARWPHGQRRLRATGGWPCGH